MKRAVFKLLILLLPLIFISVCYLLIDPYQDFSFRPHHEFDIQMLSRGDLSTKVYLENVDAYKYNSFIFGSSRSTAHTSSEWKKYLHSSDVPFSFGAWNESILGIYKRLKLIDSIRKPINNVFIVIDIDKAFNLGPINWDYYLLTGETKKNYYLQHYYNYIQNPRMVFTSVDYYIFGKKRSYMQGFIGQSKGDINPINNDWEPASDLKINSDSINYYSNSANNFYKRPAKLQISKQVIGKIQIGVIHHILTILKKNKAKYTIVISPLYDQIKINPNDIDVLEKIFGKNNIYDFSGINYLTNNKFNYASDAFHYRKRVGNRIFKEIYK